MAITLQSIATEAGVSVNTVSNVLNGRNREAYPSAAKRAQFIRQIAAKRGYRPNLAARSTRSGRFGAVALLISTESTRSTLPQGMLQGVLDSLGEHDLQLMITRLPDEKLTSDGFVPKVLTHAMSDGLLVNYTDRIPEKMVGLIHAHKLPAIWLNAPLATDCVSPDDCNAGRRAAEHLLKLGHRRIAYVGMSDSSHHSCIDRYKGYASAMVAAGLSPRKIGFVGGDVRRFACITAMLRETERPTAIVSYGGWNSDVICMVATQLGLQLPADLSLVHFGGGPTASFALKTYTAMVVPEAAMGRRAVAMLVAKIAKPQDILPVCHIPFDFEPGATVAPPR